MLQDTSISINPAVSIESDPVSGLQKQQELSLTSSLDIQSIERSAARLTKLSTSDLSDLKITGHTLPSSFYAGDRVNFTYTEKNSGTAKAGASKTKFWLSKDKIWDSSDILLSNSDSVAAIDFGKSSIESASLKTDSKQAPGKYHILMEADADKVVTESNENNNFLTASITIKAKADLTISNVTAVPSVIKAGDKIAVSYTEKNIGAATVGAHQTGIYLSKDKLFDSGDVSLNSITERSLGIGSSRTTSKTLSLDSNLATGDYYVLVVADPNKGIVESNEKNNTGYTKIKVTGSPDLSFSSVSAPDSGTAGSTIALTYTLTNAGTGTAGVHNGSFYLSTDNVLDGNDVQLDTNAEDFLAAGTSRNGTASIELPAATLTGDYYILFAADSGNAVTESNEGNNVSSKAIYINGVPDLTVSSLSVPVTARPGERITIDYSEQNLGGEAVVGSDTHFYLSTDNVFDLATDTYLNYNFEYEGIGAGGSFEGSVEITPSASLAAGTYYIFAVSDAYDHVTEIDETNNVSLPQMITIAGEPVDGPDLVFSSVSVSARAYETYPGTYITIADPSYTVLNQGNADAGFHYPTIRLSTDRFLDSSDIGLTIGTIGFTGPLAAGESRSGFMTTDTYSIPEGNYYVLLAIDGGDQVVEIDESNNIWVSDRTYYIPG